MRRGAPRDVDAITERIKDDLESFIPAEGLILPERFRQAKPDSYARRLLYRDPELGFTALVMTWGPGQRTAAPRPRRHLVRRGGARGGDGGDRYELLEEEEDGLCRFAERGPAQATAGTAGALIPPFEHHVLANARPDQASLTLHVYGGEMDHCDIFEPVGEAAVLPAMSAQLSYDE